jgi:arylsulfatase B
MRAVLLLLLALAATTAALPNLILLLSDDLGFNAPGYRNPALITPALDELASTGVRLDSFYSYMFCSPSRASFLTGRYPFKTEGTRNNLIPFSQLDGLNLNFTLLPKKLKTASTPYRTVAVGKWHQGCYAEEYTPTRRGFDFSDGFLAGGQDHFTQKSFGECGCAQNDIFVNGSVDPSLQGEYNSNRFTASAVAAIQAHDPSPSSPPLFLYVALQNTHAPLEALDEYRALYPPNMTDDLERTYSAMMSTIDSSVANITAALKAKGMWENSVVVWASDNGAPVQVGGSNWPLRGSKGSNWEGGVRLPALVNGGLLPASARGTVRTGLVHMADLYATFANLAGVSSDDGTWAPVDGLDVWPYVTGANATSPRTRIVHQHDMYSGVSVGALRDGDYKLIVNAEPWATWYGVNATSSGGHFSPPPGGSVPNPTLCNVSAPCLFNIAEDPNEETDVAAQNPALVAQMLAIFASYDAEHHPPMQDPPKDAAGCCAESKKNGGYLAPWRAPA